MIALGVSALPFDDSAGFTAPPSFGPFRVLHQIGSGVLGPVFRTFDPRHDKLVAVKAFRLDVVPEVSARLADALRQLASTPLDHPAAVAAMDAGLDGTTAYLAMEYVAAETLDVRLRRLAPATLEAAVPVLREVADAIEAAWAAGRGHGSLHPRDIFLPPLQGKAAGSVAGVRVTGFGVTAALESLNIAVPLRRPYTAPEREQGGKWDIQADVYSLGVIAHELLTGERPVGSLEESDGHYSDMDRDVRRALAGALAVDATYRFQTPTAFVNALGMGAFHRVAPAPVPLALPFERVPELDAQAEPEPHTEAEPRPDRETEIEPVESGTSVDRDQVWPPAMASEPASTSSREAWRVTPEPKRDAMPRFLGLAALLAIALGVGTAFGYWLRGPSGEPPVKLDLPALSVTEVPEEQPLGTEVAVQPSATPSPTPTPTPTRPTPSPVNEPVQSQLPVRSVPRRAPVAGPAAPAASVAPAARTGTVVVESRPDGATVSVDGRVVGQTPLRALELSPGSYTVRLTLQGYKTVTATVVVRAGQQTPLRVSLEVQ